MVEITRYIDLFKIIVGNFCLALHILAKHNPQTYSSKLSFESAWVKRLHNAVFSPSIMAGPILDRGSSPIDLAVGLVLKTYTAF